MESSRTRTTIRPNLVHYLNQAIENVESLLDGGLERYRPKLPAWLGCQAARSPQKKLAQRATWFLSGLAVTILLCSNAPGYYSSVGTRGLRTKPYASVGFAGVANGVQSRNLRGEEHSAVATAPHASQTDLAPFGAANAGSPSKENGFVADPMSAIGASLASVPSASSQSFNFVCDASGSEIRRSLTIFEQLQNTVPFKNHLAFLLRTIGRGCQFAGTIAFITGLVTWVRSRFDRRLGLSALATATLAYGVPEAIRVLSLFSLGVNPFI